MKRLIIALFIVLATSCKAKKEIIENTEVSRDSIVLDSTKIQLGFDDMLILRELCPEPTVVEVPGKDSIVYKSVPVPVDRIIKTDSGTEVQLKIENNELSLRIEQEEIELARLRSELVRLEKKYEREKTIIKRDVLFYVLLAYSILATLFIARILFFR